MYIVSTPSYRISILHTFPWVLIAFSQYSQSYRKRVCKQHTKKEKMQIAKRKGHYADEKVHLVKFEAIRIKSNRFVHETGNPFPWPKSNQTRSV